MCVRGVNVRSYMDKERCTKTSHSLFRHPALPYRKFFLDPIAPELSFQSLGDIQP